MKNLIFFCSFILLFSCGNKNGGFYSTLNDSKSSAIKVQLENYLSKNYEPMSSFYHDSLMLFVSGSNDTLNYSDVFEGIELHHTLFSNIDIPMQDGDIHVETSNYGGGLVKSLLYLERKEGLLNKRCQTLFILHTDGLETRLLKSTITATEQLLKMKLGYILKQIINKNENEKYYYNYFTKFYDAFLLLFLKRSENILSI